MKSARTFQDEFSGQAMLYTEFRPRYPAEIYSFLAGLTPAREIAWDCGTGNGQAAVDLAQHFTTVYATDPSKQQIEHAIPHAKVRYSVGSAEKSLLADHSADIITAAQAAHWFDFAAFIPEVRRVLKPDGVIALWAYGFHHSGDKKVDDILDHIGKTTLKDFWSPQPKMIWNGYKDIPFPFKRIPNPGFRISVNWSMKELIGYFSTWSATQKYIQQTGQHPVQDHYSALTEAWGEPERRRELSCPIVMLVGRV